MLIIAIPLLLSQFQHSFNSNNDSAAYCICIQSNDHVFSSLYSYMNKIDFFMNINSKTTTLMLCAYSGLDNNWESFVAADITKRSEIKNPWSWYQHTCGSDMRQAICDNRHAAEPTDSHHCVSVSSHLTPYISIFYTQSFHQYLYYAIVYTREWWACSLHDFTICQEMSLCGLFFAYCQLTFSNRLS